MILRYVNFIKFTFNMSKQIIQVEEANKGSVTMHPSYMAAMRAANFYEILEILESINLFNLRIDFSEGAARKPVDVIFLSSQN